MRSQKHSIIKTILAAAGALLLILLAVRVAPTLLGRDEADADTRSFTAQKVTRGTFEQTVASTGSLTAVGTVEVGTQVSGTVSKVLVDYNDRVVKGQVLAILDQSSFEAAVTVSEAAVSMQEAQLAQASAEYDRYLPLFEAGHLSDEEFLSYRTALKTAEASLRQARAELTRNRINMDHTVIRSPIEGTVIERSVDGGQTVAASLSSPTLFIIARDLSNMEIEVSVDENDIGMVKAGQEVRFTVPAYVDDIFTGRVSTIRLNPEVVSNVVNYKVIVDVKDTRGVLLPGMTATVDFVVKKIEDALLVPNTALRFASKASGSHAPSSSQGPDSKPGEPLFVMTPSGQARLVKVSVLADNGSVSAVGTDGEIKEGTLVAIGQDTTGGSSEVESGGGIASRLFPRPHGAGRPNR
jgi:HlyD family secretion protein